MSWCSTLALSFGALAVIFFIVGLVTGETIDMDERAHQTLKWIHSRPIGSVYMRADTDTLFHEDGTPVTGAELAALEAWERTKPNAED